MSRASSLLSGRLLVGNAIWNLVGIALPLTVGIWTIPYLIEGMGTVRFGLLSIVWMGIGYFSLFDLGIGRALTQMVSERLGRGELEGLPALIRLGLTLMGLLGLSGALLVLLITPYLTQSVFNIPSGLEQEALWSFWILGLSLPCVVTSAGLIGVLQSFQRFREIAIIRIVLGISNFLGPLLMLYLTTSLVATTTALVAFRVLAWLGYRHLCTDHLQLDENKGMQITNAKTLIAFGGWFMVSNILGPMMMYFDRFLIAALTTMTLVTYYSVPFDIVTRTLAIPDALAAVLFPALSMALQADQNKACQLLHNANRILMLVMFPVLAWVMLFSVEGVVWWLGEEFATHSLGALHWLTVGVFITSQARLPYLTLQGAGRPDLTAKLHMVEIIPYFSALWYGISKWGIVGAAGVWVGRIAFDATLLYLIAMRRSPQLRREHINGLIFTASGAVALGVLSSVDAAIIKIILAAIIVSLCAWHAWSLYFKK